MTFGLTGSSRKLLKRIAQSTNVVPGAVRKKPGPIYLPLQSEPELGLAAHLKQWIEPEERIPDELDNVNPTAGETNRDCVLVGKTIHHKQQMELLCRARRSLRDGGRLLVVGEFLREVTKIHHSSLPTEFSLLQLSERLGFRLIEQTDWTGKARQSIADARALIAGRTTVFRFPPAAWLQSLLAGARASRKLASAREIQVLDRELESLAAEFESGHRRFGCFVFELDASSGGPWSELALGDIGSFEPEELAGIFEESFGAKFDPALWRWKYGAGKGTCIVARESPGGPVIAHYGGVAREVDYFGADQLAFQGCDVMVKPAVRRQYGRNSLYFHMTATLFEREIGYTVDHVLGFGFPNKPVMKTAMRLGLYGKVDDYVELAFTDPGAADSPVQVEPLGLEQPSRLEAADALWQSMRRDFLTAVVGKRHGEYLRYRYHDHPHAENYESLLLTRAGKPFAIAVLKRHEAQWLLMDLLAPLASMNTAVAALRNWLDSHREPGPLTMWLTSAWVEKLGWQGRIVKNLGIEIPFNAWNPGPDQTLPQGAWWLTAGDMDFI